MIILQKPEKTGYIASAEDIDVRDFAGTFFRSTPNWTWIHVPLNPALIPWQSIPKSNELLRLQCLMDGARFLDTLLTKFFCQHVWHPFEIPIECNFSRVGNESGPMCRVSQKSLRHIRFRERAEITYKLNAGYLDILPTICSASV
jgi:hypothetical protein